MTILIAIIEAKDNKNPFGGRMQQAARIFLKSFNLPHSLFTAKENSFLKQLPARFIDTNILEIMRNKHQRK